MAAGRPGPGPPTAPCVDQPLGSRSAADRPCVDQPLGSGHGASLR